MGLALRYALLHLDHEPLRMRFLYVLGLLLFLDSADLALKYFMRPTQSGTVDDVIQRSAQADA